MCNSGSLASTLTITKKTDEKEISSHEQHHNHGTTLEPRPRARISLQHQLEDHLIEQEIHKS